MSDDKMDIEQIRQRYEDLKTRKIQAETNLKNAESQLDDLKKQSMELYKTDDVAALTRMLHEMEQENERKQNEYVASLDKIESDLAEVEQKYSNLESESVA